MSSITVTETTANASAAATPAAPPPSSQTATATSTKTAVAATAAATAATTRNNNNKFDFGSYVPEDKVQYIVQTPYGRGLTIRTWKNNDQSIRMREIELLDWTTSTTATTSSTTITRGPVRPATLFSPLLFSSVEPKLDDDVVCLYGRGRVQELRSSGHVVVRLSSWRLAGRSTIICILNTNSVQVVRKKKMYEMNTHERVELAQQLKTTAGKLFSKKDYSAALQSYTHAIDALRYISETHSRAVPPEIRADLVILMITCNNNAATCTWHLASHHHDTTTTSTDTITTATTNTTTDTDTAAETLQRRQQQQQSLYAEKTLKYARDAMVLLDALEKNKGQRIHEQLVKKDGTYSDIKLFGEMKVKSYILQARALMHQYETVQALECLKTAHDIIAHYTSTASSNDSNNSNTTSTSSAMQTSIKNLHSSSKDIKKLHQTCRERRIKEKQKEKLRAQAMFASSSSSSSAEEKKEITSQPSSPTNDMQHPQQEDDDGKSMGYESMTRSQDDDDNDNHDDDDDDDDDDNHNHDDDDDTMKPKVKRRVSFSEKVIYKEEIEGCEAEYPLRPPAISPKKKNSSTMANKYSKNKTTNINNRNNQIDELEWHEDPEVVTGLYIFAGTVALTVMGTWYLLSGKRA